MRLLHRGTFFKWRAKLKRIASSLYYLSIMVLEDLRGKVDLISTVLPTIYWITVIDYADFSLFDFRFFYLSCGIILIAIQMFLQNIYYTSIKLTETQTIETTRKINKTVIALTFITIAYGLKTFFYMITNQKNIVIWTLIVFYIVGILFIIFTMVYLGIKNPKILKELNKLIE